MGCQFWDLGKITIRWTALPGLRHRAKNISNVSRDAVAFAQMVKLYTITKNTFFFTNQFNGKKFPQCYWLVFRLWIR
jgi:hypothetical protein